MPNPIITDTCNNCDNKFIPDKSDVFRVTRGYMNSAEEFMYTETYGEFCKFCFSKFDQKDPNQELNVYKTHLDQVSTLLDEILAEFGYLDKVQLSTDRIRELAHIANVNQHKN